MESVQQRIIALATERFSQLGIKSVSVDDLCGELQISKKTFYFYFQQKDDLIEDILRIKREHMEDNVTRFVKEKPALECMLRFVTMAHSLQDVRREPAFVHDLRKYYPELLKKHLDNIEAFNVQILEANLAEGIEEGVYRSDLDIKLTSLIFFSRYQYILDNLQKLHDKKLSPVKVANYSLDFFVRGIVSEKGLKILEGNN